LVVINTNCVVLEQTFSVVVIGAGVSALAAASRLKAKGVEDLVVVEARDRIGGRLWTNDTLGYPVDLGAS
jgi:phytoene dehydrogenase-like protein